jgi:four helix bundle protein
MGTAGSDSVRGYRQLIAWQKAMDLADGVCLMCASVSTRDGVGLVSQLRRAVVSIPANIAEGHGRGSRAEYVHHLRIAKGSLQETQTLLELLLRRGAAKTETLLDLIRDADELGRILHGLIKSQTRAPAPVA